MVGSKGKGLTDIRRWHDRKILAIGADRFGLWPSPRNGPLVSAPDVDDSSTLTPALLPQVRQQRQPEVPISFPLRLRDSGRGGRVAGNQGTSTTRRWTLGRDYRGCGPVLAVSVRFLPGLGFRSRSTSRSSVPALSSYLWLISLSVCLSFPRSEPGNSGMAAPKGWCAISIRRPNEPRQHDMCKRTRTSVVSSQPHLTGSIVRLNGTTGRESPGDGAPRIVATAARAMKLWKYLICGWSDIPGPQRLHRPLGWRGTQQSCCAKSLTSSQAVRRAAPLSAICDARTAIGN